jgi:hypothetical protein
MVHSPAIFSAHLRLRSADEKARFGVFLYTDIHAFLFVQLVVSFSKG